MKSFSNNQVKILSKIATITVMIDNKCFVNDGIKRNIYDQTMPKNAAILKISAIALTNVIKRPTKLATQKRKTLKPSCLLLSTTRCMMLFRQASETCLVTTVD